MNPGDKSKVFLNTVINTGAIIVEKFIFFIVNIIIARYLDINSYGEYTTALAFASFFSLFTDMGINETLIREINYEKEKDYTLFNVIVLKVILSVVLFIVFTGVTFTTEYTDEVINLSLIFGLVRFGDEYLRLYYTYYEGTDNYTTSAIYRFFFALSFSGAVLLVILTAGGNKEIALFRFSVVLFFLVLISFNILKKKSLKTDLQYIKSFAGKVAPFAAAFVYSNIINQGNMIILPLLHGTYYTGIFQNAYVFIVTIMFIPISFSRVFIPYLYQHKNDDDCTRFQFAFDIITKCFVFISFYITTVLFLYPDFIISEIFGNKYSDSIYTLKIISLAIPFLFNAANIILTALDKQKLYSRILRYIAIVNVIINIILGYYFKDKGIAIAAVITFALIFILSNWLVKRSSEISILSSLLIYAKGVLIFLLCWLAHEHITVQQTTLSILIISLLFCMLNIALLLTKNDIRIAREILNKTGN